jgi:tRNA-guanine family transglycosylase
MTSIIQKGSNYVPAIGDNIITNWLRNTTHQGKGFRFFDNNNSFFNHKYLLMSAYYRITDEDHNHKQLLNYPSDTTVISDSGGYQVMSFGKKGNPIKVTQMQVLRWMENNSDIGMNLDVPPVENFSSALTKSVENFKFFETNRLVYDNFKLYNILHGRTLDQIKQWYNAVKHFQFDGWAIGVHPSTNVYLKLIAYLYLLENGETSPLTNTHFFGVSGPANMLSLAMVAKKFDAALTFDSSSWSWGQRFRDWWFPLDVRHCVRLGREFKNTINSIPCDCPVCRTMDISQLYDQTNPMTPLLLSFHDLYQYIEVNRMINIMIDDDDTFMTYAKSLGEQSLIDNMINIINDYEQKNVSFVYKKYLPLFSSVPKEKKDMATNLFGWPEKTPKTIYTSTRTTI